jgi:hypothetical protein
LVLLVYEPAMTGVSHAEINCGFLGVLATAVPDARITFCAESEHADAVRGRLPAQYGRTVQFVSIRASDRAASFARRVPMELWQAYEVGRRARSLGADLVVVLSTTASMLAMLKVAFRGLPGVRCAVVPHAILGSLAVEPIGMRRLHPTQLARVLRMTDAGNVHLWVLGRSIENALLNRYPALRPCVDCIGHPYFFEEPPVVEEGPLRAVLVTGGTDVSGADRLFRFLDGLQALGAQGLAELEYLGYEPSRALPSWVRAPRGRGLMPRGGYLTRLRRADFLIMLHAASSYELVASGTAFDALAHARPILAVTNPFLRQLFEEVGAFGELVSSESDLLGRYVELARNGRDEHWRKWRDLILANRHRIGIEALASRVRTALAAWPI